MAVTISGMFGDDKTYFAGSPVVIDISGLEWGSPVTSPFTIVRVEVNYVKRNALNVITERTLVGTFRADTGGQTEISFDISSALRAIWADYDFSYEVAAANAEKKGSTEYAEHTRPYREYTLTVFTEYMAGDDGGVYTETSSGEIEGGRCNIGRLTEWERSNITSKGDADLSHWNRTNGRNGDASTKPQSSPELVGSSSITSWVDISNDGTVSRFYRSSKDRDPDDERDYAPHAPMVIRDSQQYQDFLFVNRRGAVETCSALMKESMSIEVETQQYARIERPSFKPSRSLMAIAKGGRRSWSMSSGVQTRDWAEWWTMEFLKASQWWMKYEGSFVPVIVEPAKKQTGIYDRVKQQMPSVEFTVTLALEG